ncbi:phage protease [Reyranella sp.]|uniref:phage protease n=1 Tax=Reyranella sp. TaxID=1929291 RepID=UPI00272F2926|nr:phage protease [Reyranella sp.]MDP2373161.1 phage protease [Reyranella sp.]
MLKHFSLGGGAAMPDLGDFTKRSALTIRRPVTASVYMPIPDGSPPEWVKLLPIGRIETNDSRPGWMIADRAEAERIVAASQARAGNRELPFDYDHQTVFSAVRGVGGTAKASGWMKQLEVRDDGIWARAEWTPAAAAALTDREYRYISPTFLDTPDGRVVSIWGAALTITPALDLPAVASTETDPEKDNPDMLKEIAAALGLPATASAADCLAAIASTREAQTASNAALGEIRTAAGLADDADAPAVCAAVAALQTAQPDQSLAQAVVTLTAEVNTLKSAGARKAAEDAVDAAIKAGQIVPATREVFVTLASSSPAEFQKLIGVQPVVLTPGAMPQSAADPSAVTLSDEDRAVIAATGVDADAFLATKQKDAA